MKTSRRTLLLVTALAMFSFSFSLLAADTFQSAARALADKIIAAMGSLEHFELTFRNLSSLDPERAAEAWKVVESEFRSRGIRFDGESDASAKIRVTLSENPQDYLWVAEIARGQSREQLMVAQIRPRGVGAAGVPARMVIRTELIFESDEPILDLAFLEKRLLVLDTRHLSLYRRLDDRWNLEQTSALAESWVWPRDVRGRLSLQGNAIQARLPGGRCSGTVQPEFTMECTRDESPWPLESGPAKFDSTRNYFVQVDLPPFFSSAGVRRDGDRLWVFAGVDGRARLYDNAFQPAGSIPGWGSDIAGVDSGCGTRRQLLVTLPGDLSDRGTIQAFEIIRRQPVAATPPAEFPGPITALWSLPSGNAAFAITRNIKTGRYAAHHLSITCGQ